MHPSVRAIHDTRGGAAASAAAGRSTDGAGAEQRRDGTDAQAVRSLVVEVAERASSMRERLTSKMVTYPPPAGGPERASLEAWCASAARGDRAIFARRLALDALDPCGAHRAVGRVSMAPDSVLPEWARLVERYIHALRDAGQLAIGGGGGIPFVQIFLPLANVVERELRDRAVHALQHASRTAQQRLRTALLERLARPAAPILQERFESYRATHATNAGRVPAITSAADAPSAGSYRGFVYEMLHGGMVELIRELPVLARVMATTALLWRDASAELLLRLHADRHAIADFFAGGREPGLLTELEPGLSDAHSGGRTVHVLTFASGLRLVYKPRGLGIDAAFEALLSWSALRGAPLPASDSGTLAPRVLDRGSHGWAERLEHRACTDHSSVCRYYENAGSLLALLHALGSTDCHYENIVANGERPMLVDLETVLQPEIERADPPLDRARNIGARLLYDDSALRTGLLPAWQDAGGDRAYDTGGLSASAGQTTPFTTMRWSAIDSDAMQMERRHATIDARSNLPVLEERPIPPARHVNDIALGFGRMYQWLSAHRDALLAPDGPVARLARERVRFIARPSSVYDYVLRRSLRRHALRDGVARDIELELLARGLLPLSHELWPLLQMEKQALAQLDIPAFTLRGDATELTLGERSIRLARSGLDVARSRLSSLSPEDLELQLSIIRAAFALRYFDVHAATSAGDAAPAAAGTACDAPPVSRAEIVDAAMEIAAEIGRKALVNGNGEITWITTEPISTAGHARLQTTGYGLYDGLAGIALFLAAVARCSGDPRMALLARRALAPVRDRLRSAAPAYVDEYGIGGACGAASVTYALLRAGTFLGDDALIDDALHAARQLTPEAIERDASFDVLYGGAGAILALLALHRVRRSDALLELAHQCGRHLLGRRRPARTSEGITYEVWPTVGGRVQIGFAHGSAGMVAALLRLHAATGITEYLEAALDAVRYEDSLLRVARRQPSLSDTESNDPRAPREDVEVPTNWCRGMAGVVLARLACTAGSHTGELRASAERALADVVWSGGAAMPALDSACCGAAGYVELLLTAGLKWGDAGLLAAAHGRASELVRRGRTARRYRLSASPGAEVYDPSLYRGTAGIGYGLLRLCHPELLPSFLSWE